MSLLLLFSPPRRSTRIVPAGLVVDAAGRLRVASAPGNVRVASLTSRNSCNMSCKSTEVLTPHKDSARRHYLDFDPPRMLNAKRLLAPPDVVISSLVSLTATPASAVIIDEAEVVDEDTPVQGRTIEEGTGVSAILREMTGELFTLEAVVTLNTGETEVLQVEVKPTGK